MSIRSYLMSIRTYFLEVKAMKALDYSILSSTDIKNAWN